MFRDEVPDDLLACTDKYNRPGKLPQHTDGKLEKNPGCDELMEGNPLFQDWPLPNEDGLKWDSSSTGFNTTRDCKLFVYYSSAMNGLYGAFARDSNEHPIAGEGSYPRPIRGGPSLKMQVGGWLMQMYDESISWDPSGIFAPNRTSLSFDLTETQGEKSTGVRYPRSISWNTTAESSRCIYKEVTEGPLRGYRYWVCPFQCSVVQGVPPTRG